MTGKRMKKLLMSIGYSRNFAELLRGNPITYPTGATVPNAAIFCIFGGII